MNKDSKDTIKNDNNLKNENTIANNNNVTNIQKESIVKNKKNTYDKNKKKFYKKKNVVSNIKLYFPFFHYHFLNINFLKQFLNARLELKNRNQNSLNRKNQKKIEKHVKIARKLGLIPHIKYS